MRIEEVARGQMTILYVMKKLKDFEEFEYLPHLIDFDIEKIEPYIMGYYPSIEETYRVIHSLGVEHNWSAYLTQKIIALFEMLNLPSQKKLDIYKKKESKSHVIDDTEQAQQIIQEIIEKGE